MNSFKLFQFAKKIKRVQYDFWHPGGLFAISFLLFRTTEKDAATIPDATLFKVPA